MAIQVTMRTRDLRHGSSTWIFRIPHLCLLEAQDKWASSFGLLVNVHESKYTVRTASILAVKVRVSWGMPVSRALIYTSWPCRHGVFTGYNHISRYNNWNIAASASNGCTTFPSAIQLPQSYVHPVLEHANNAYAYSQKLGYQPAASQSISTTAYAPSLFFWMIMFFICKSPWENVALWPAKTRRNVWR